MIQSVSFHKASNSTILVPVTPMANAAMTVDELEFSLMEVNVDDRYPTKAATVMPGHWSTLEFSSTLDEIT